MGQVGKYPWWNNNVLRAKLERLRGNFDAIRMKEGENVTQYYGQIKEVVNVIRGIGGQISDETMISKVLRTSRTMQLECLEFKN